MDSTKAWHQSRGVWGAIVAFAAIVLGAFGVNIGDVDQNELIDKALVISGAIGSLVGLYGRVMAKSKIRAVMPLLLVPALALMMAACATQEAETPAQKLYAAQSEFNIAQRIALAYMEQPECGDAAVVGCAKPDIKKQVRSMVLKAHTALTVARTDLESTRAAGSVAFAAALVRDLVAYLAQKELSLESNDRAHDPQADRPHRARRLAGAGHQGALRRHLGQGPDLRLGGARSLARGMG